MDISSIQEPGGEELIQQLVELTGLPENLVLQELDQILGMTGQASSDVTLETLRTAMLVYLESLQTQLALDQN